MDSFIGFSWNRKEISSNRDKFLQKDKNGQFGLHIAARLGVELSILKDIVEINPDALREKDKFGCLPIHYASNCRSTSLESLQFFVNQSPRSIRERDGVGLLPIHHLAQHQTNVEVFIYIDRIFSDAVREKDKDGWIALHFAAKSNTSVEVLQFLVLRYAGGLRESTVFGSLPIHCAAHYNKSLSVLEYLVSQHPGGLTEKGANGMLPLHSAARNNPSVAVLDYLIGKNPDGLTTGDKNGRVPLHHAVRNVNASVIVRYLTELYPAMLRHRDTSGWTPLHSAGRYASNPAVVRYLAEQYPAALQATDEDGWLPLHHCARGNSSHMDVLKLLVDLYPDALTSKNADAYPHDLAPASSDARSYLTLFHVAMQLDGRNQPMDVLRLHLLGDVGCGKSLAAHWFKTLLPADSLNVDLFDETHDIAWRHGRTQGMEVNHVTLRLSDRVTHYLIQDYSGASHHLSHHLHYLHAPDSCFVIVLPLFDRVRRVRNSLSQLTQRLLYWTRLLFSRARTSNGGIHIMLILNAFVSDVKVSTDELQDIKARLTRTLRRNFTLRYTCRAEGASLAAEDDDSFEMNDNKHVSLGQDEDTARYSYNYYGNSSADVNGTGAVSNSATSAPSLATEQQTVWLVGGDIFVADLRSKFSLNRATGVLRHQAPLAISTKVFRQSRILTYCWEVINMIDFSAVMQAEDVMQMLASAVRSFFTKQPELDQLMVHNALRKGVCEEVEARLLQHLIAFLVRLERLRLLDTTSFYPDAESDRLVITDPTAVSRHIVGAIVQQVSNNMKRSVVELAQTPRELASWVRGMPAKTMSPAVPLEKLLTQLGFALPMVQRSQPVRTKPEKSRLRLRKAPEREGEPFDDIGETAMSRDFDELNHAENDNHSDEDSIDEEVAAACCKHDVVDYLMETQDQLASLSLVSSQPSPVVSSSTNQNPYALKSAFLVDAHDVDNISMSSSSSSSSASSDSSDSSDDSSDDDSSDDDSDDASAQAGSGSDGSEDEGTEKKAKKSGDSSKSSKKSKKKKDKERLRREKKKAKKAKKKAKRKAKKEQKRKEKEARYQKRLEDKRALLAQQQQLLLQQQSLAATNTLPSSATTTSSVQPAQQRSHGDVFYYLHSLVGQSCLDSDAFVVAGLKPISHAQRCVSRVFRLVSPRYVLPPGYLSSLTTFICAAVRNQAAVTFYRDGLRLLFRHTAHTAETDVHDQAGDLTQILIVPHVVPVKELSDSTMLALTPASFNHDTGSNGSDAALLDNGSATVAGRSAKETRNKIDDLILGFEVHISSQIPVYRRQSGRAAAEDEDIDITKDATSTETDASGQYVDVAWETMTLVRALITAHGQTSGFNISALASASASAAPADAQSESQGRNIHDTGGYAVHGETCCLLFRGLAEFCVHPKAPIYRGTVVSLDEGNISNINNKEDNDNGLDRELMSVTEAETMWFAATSTAEVSSHLLALYLGTGLDRNIYGQRKTTVAAGGGSLVRGYGDHTALVLGLSVTDSAVSVSAATAYVNLFIAATTSPTGSSTNSANASQAGLTVQDLARMTLMSHIPTRTQETSDLREQNKSQKNSTDINEDELECDTVRDLTAIVLNLLRHRLWRDHHSQGAPVNKDSTAANSSNSHASAHQTADSGRQHHRHHHHHHHLVSVSRDRVRAIVRETLMLRNVFLRSALFTTRNIQDLPLLPCLTRCNSASSSFSQKKASKNKPAVKGDAENDVEEDASSESLPSLCAYRLHFFCPVCLERAPSGFSSTANYLANGGGADAFPGYLLRVLGQAPSDDRSDVASTGDIVPQWDSDVIAALELSVAALENALRVQPRHAQTAEFGALMQDTLELLLTHVASTAAATHATPTEVLQRAQRLFRVQQGVFASLKHVINRGARTGYLFAEDLYDSGNGGSGQSAGKAVLVDENREHLLPSIETGGGALRMSQAMSAGLRKLLLAAGDEHVLHTGLRKVTDSMGQAMCVCAPVNKRSDYGVNALGKSIRNAVMGFMDVGETSSEATGASSEVGVGGTGRLYDVNGASGGSGRYNSGEGNSRSAEEMMYSQSSCAKEFLRRGHNALIVRVKM